MLYYIFTLYLITNLGKINIVFKNTERALLKFIKYVFDGFDSG